MNWVWVASHETIKRSNYSSPAPPAPPAPPSPGSPGAVYDSSSFQSKISPSILLIIVILAVIFFISGLLHLLVRYLLRPTSRDPDELDNANATALQGQLQQLFHLHDAGVDQSFIDTLPVFLYRAIIGLKDPFDCAVCLCEFEADDKLRLLPKCSHAFHVDCIDTWLLSHSTCPLCRSSLLPDYSPASTCSPMLLLLESASDTSREIASERMLDFGPNSLLAFAADDDLGPFSHEFPPKAGEFAGAKDQDMVGIAVSDASQAKIVPVKLGKFRSVEICGSGEGQGTSTSTTSSSSSSSNTNTNSTNSNRNNGGGGNNNTNLDQRRCFSMGSYEYVMDETSSLKVPIKPPKKKPNTAAAAAAAAAAMKKPGHRLAMSECDCNSRREGFKGFEALRICDAETARSSTAIQKRESFSISKTWLRQKDCRPVGSGDEFARRASSFRLPFHRAAADESKRKTGGELELDLESGSCSKSLTSRADEAPSFARRTLNWIVGRQNRVGNHL